MIRISTLERYTLIRMQTLNDTKQDVVAERMASCNLALNECMWRIYSEASHGKLYSLHRDDCELPGRYFVRLRTASNEVGR